MSIYKYRFCQVDEIDKFKKFINSYWKKGHILSQSDELIHFQYDVPGENYLSIVVAENQETAEFDGVFGYINNWRYAPSHGIPKTLWGAVWKVRDDVTNKEIGSVGIGLLRFIFKNDTPEIWSSLGISGKHKDIAKSMNYCVGDMNRYYIPNQKVESFRVIKSPDINNLSSEVTDSYVKEIDFPFGYAPSLNMNPYKDIEYFENRYKNHISFTYRFLGLFKKEEMKGVFVFRNVDSAGPRVLRIMDFIGDLTEIHDVNVSVQELLRSESAEYIDCLNHGIDSRFFHQLGFKEAIKGGETILPEYFDPFDQRYVPMEYAYISDDDNPLVIFKADGDQDRPNSINTI